MDNVLCPICLSEIDRDFCTTSCGHLYHIDCYKEHNQYHSNCAICRNSLKFIKTKDVICERKMNITTGNKWTIFKNTDGIIVSSIPAWVI